MLSPRWLAGTLLALLAVAVCVVCAVWQFHRAESVSGTLQNAGYAVQWPLFAVFFAFLWWRMLRLELTGSREQPVTRVEPAARDEQAADPGPSPFAHRPAPARPEPAPDSALAAYNRMLAELAAREGSEAR